MFSHGRGGEGSTFMKYYLNITQQNRHNKTDTEKVNVFCKVMEMINFVVS